MVQQAGGVVLLLLLLLVGELNGGSCVSLRSETYDDRWVERVEG